MADRKPAEDLFHTHTQVNGEAWTLPLENSGREKQSSDSCGHLLCVLLYKNIQFNVQEIKNIKYIIKSNNEKISFKQ